MYKLLLFILCFSLFSTSYADALYPTSSQVERNPFCVGCSVSNAHRATGNDLSSFATMQVQLGVLSSIELTLTFPESIDVGSFVSLIVEGQQLTSDLLSEVTFSLMQNNRPVANTGWTILPFGASSSIKVLSTLPTASVNKVSIRLSGLLTFPKTLRVYGASSDISPLPVELVSFSFEQLGGSVRFDWISATERNNAYFELQQSLDAKTWKPLSRLAGSGDAKEVTSYSYTHLEPLASLSYYRLKQVDRDSSFYYSKIISVYGEEHEGRQEIIVYPNPVRRNELLTIHSRHSGQWASLELYSLDGKGFLNYPLWFESFSSTLSIPDGLPPGLYHLLIRSSKGIERTRIVIH